MPADLLRGEEREGKRVGDHAHRDSQPSASRHTQAQRRKPEARDHTGDGHDRCRGSDAGEP